MYENSEISRTWFYTTFEEYPLHGTLFVRHFDLIGGLCCIFVAHYGLLPNISAANACRLYCSVL